jgi:hypothetical protein
MFVDGGGSHMLPLVPAHLEEFPRDAVLLFLRGFLNARSGKKTTAQESGAGRNVLDGDPATIWHTKWFGQSLSHPHHIILD